MKEESARALTVRLISREMANATAPNLSAHAAHAACERSFRLLITWLGTTGAELLMRRALTQARPTHPALADIKLQAPPEPGLSGVDEAIHRHGGALMAEGLEAVLLAMIVLLVRLIGEKMTAQLLDSSLENALMAAENQNL